MSKRKVNFLSTSDKLEIIREFEAGKTRETIIKDYNVPKSTLGRILQSKEKIELKCLQGQGRHKKMRLAEYPELEKCLVDWLKQCLDSNIPVSGPIIQEKAKEFAKR